MAVGRGRVTHKRGSPLPTLPVLYDSCTPHPTAGDRRRETTGRGPPSPIVPIRLQRLLPLLWLDSSPNSSFPLSNQKLVPSPHQHLASLLDWIGSGSLLQAQATDGLVASRAETKALPCQRDDDSHGGEHDIRIPYLPEDTWRHIHSLMPMQYAAQAACVSHTFLRSRRSYPNLTFCGTTFGMNKRAYGNDEIARYFCSKADHIVKNHSGNGVKKLEIDMNRYYTANDSCCLNGWLLTAVTPGIEEISLAVSMKETYSFPCSLLSNGSGDSIRCLKLGGCSFRPTAELPWFKSLTKVQLNAVSITEDELGCLLCNSFALEQLGIRYCDEIICLKIPCILRRLSCLEVFCCGGLQVIDNKAPNMSRFFYGGGRDHLQLSLGEASLNIEYIRLSFPGALPSGMPNLKIASIRSRREMVNKPMLHSKFLHLEKLYIALTAGSITPAYDYFSLVSFLDTCPSLETLVLDVSLQKMEYVSVFTDPSDLRKMQGQQQHHKLKRVQILGFTSAKSLVELTCHFVESVTSLEHLTLEAQQSFPRCDVMCLLTIVASASHCLLMFSGKLNEDSWLSGHTLSLKFLPW